MKKILSLGVFLAAWTAGFACTNFLVGKDASADGSTIISYAADSYSFYGYLHFSPAADHLTGSMREVINWDNGKPLCSIPEVAHTYNVVGNTNEHQLTVGETTWGGLEQLWDTVGIDYGSLIYIALERCKTAREAIMLVTSLVREYGYASEGETFSFGDPNEIWMMDLIGKGPGEKGAVWVAVRIPDDCIAAHANQARIQGVPAPTKAAAKLAKKTGYVDLGNIIYSADVISFARKKGLFSGKDDEFSFQKVYNPFDFSGLLACEARVWSFYRHFSTDMDKYLPYVTGQTFLATGGKDAGEAMPLYIKPNHKVSVQEIKDCMRDQYEGTPLDITKGTASGPWHSKLRYGSLKYELDSVAYWYQRPTATQQTAWSFVSQMRGYESAKAGGIFWFGVDDAATNLYVPMFSRITEVPECFRKGNGDLYTYSPTSAWWTYNLVANKAYEKYERILPEIRVVQQTWEEKFNAQVLGIDAEVAMMDKDKMAKFLTSYSCNQAQESTAAWKDLYIYLITKYIDGQERKTENGQFLRNAYGNPEMPNRPAYPEPFLRTIAPETLHE